MAVTRLKRKHKRNIIKAKNKVKAIKRLKSTPVIRNIDVEAVKAEFAKNSSKPKAEPKAATSQKEEKPAAKEKTTAKKTPKSAPKKKDS